MNRSHPTIAEEAQALVASVERTLQEQEERIRRMGLNPAKVREFGARTLTPAQCRQAEDMVRADMADVEQAVAQAGVHRTGCGVAKARRRFI